VCGIVGQVGEPGSIAVDAVVAARDTLVHRGPDDAGVYVTPDRSVGLGHRRLSIIDLSSAGHQPMRNRTGSLWLVFNGEIYNFRALRDQLERLGHQFQSATDSEVILHAYEEWGIDSVRRLRGMFAYALWDSRARALHLVRDRLGIKPLFYWHDGTNLAFASEIRGVLADRRVPRTLDESALYDFFTYQYVPAPKTAYAAVRKLEAGHYAVFQAGRLRIERYWDFELGSASAARTADDAVAAVRAALERVVGDHLVADVGVGVLLSGGIDSSAVTGLAARATSDPLNTFTIGFDVGEHSEAHFARELAELVRSQHTELTVTREMALAMRQRVVSLYDEPYADGSAIPTLLVAELARRHVTVALSGEGGDEVFGGYNWYTRWLQFEGRLALPPAVRRVLFGVPARLLRPGARGKWNLEMRSLEPLVRYARLMGAFLGREKAAVLSPQFLKRFDGYDDLWHFRTHWHTDLDPLLRLQYLDLKTYLPDDLLTKFDRATMAVSLEGRVPLLDHELVELVLRLPLAVRNPGFAQKHLLKRAVADVLPPGTLTREKKGFSVPWYAWVKNGPAHGFGRVHDGVLHPRVADRVARLASEDLWRITVMNTWLTDCAGA
jgi:asparagine synthase (glutamine-hydrolysing)